MKVRLFNGFVKNAFPARHQTSAQMNDWSQKLAKAIPDVVTYENQHLSKCWAYPMVSQVSSIENPVWSADYPNSPPDRYATPYDALISQIVLCERFQWLSDVVEYDPTVDVWAWVEPTIFKQRGITGTVLRQFVEDIEKFPVDAISLPGVLPKIPVIDHVNHWRFAGSAWVCPRKYAKVVSATMKELITMRTRLTHRLCWDNSSWSYLEHLNVLPMRWYPGNHDETQLTGYKVGVTDWPMLTGASNDRFM